MGLSEAEIEARLAALRRRREALDREIADLVLYLELGRRLAGPGAAPDTGLVEARPGIEPATDAPLQRRPVPGVQPSPLPSAPPALGAHRTPAPPAGGLPASGEPGADGAIPPAISFAEDAVGARRYGRALVTAACTAIAQAGRPLHAAEILAVLVGQGFTVPGRDPVAALNTRLWKRSGPGGPLCRVGEATYALATPA